MLLHGAMQPCHTFLFAEEQQVALSAFYECLESLPLRLAAFEQGPLFICLQVLFV